jgi:hypothetical protein
VSEALTVRRGARRLPIVVAIVVGIAAVGGLSALAWQEWRTDDPGKTKVVANPAAATAKARTARDPDAASRIVEAFIADMRAANGAFAKDLASEGYIEAIGGPALQNPAALSAAPERIRGARRLFDAARQKQLQRTETAVAAVKALPAQNEVEEILLEDLLDEFSKNRSARQAYWNAMLDSADAMEGMARVLIRTQGGWTPDPVTRSILFVNDADAAAYEAEAGRRAEYEAEADRRLGQLNRSADALTTMAKRWGKDG